jgi:hypothetical protein
MGQGVYETRFTYTGENWTHAVVAPIPIETDKPIAVLPVQYTANSAQPGAAVNGMSVGLKWNSITQEEMSSRLEALGFYVLTPTIQMYGEDWDGFQGLEHFIAGVHKGNTDVQTLLITADAAESSPQNPQPGAQMLVTGLHQRNFKWEELIQNSIAGFYGDVELGNVGARVRGGLSDEEGAADAWHPLIERAAEYGATVSIMEAARAIDIVEQAGSIEAGREWAAPLFDLTAEAMATWACTKGFDLPTCGKLMAQTDIATN